MGQFTDKKEIERILAILDPAAPTSRETVEKLTAYTREIVRWNKRVNLTGAGSARHFVAGPLFDALTLVPTLARSGTVVDMGSGGGLPGIPAAILVPGIRFTLVEPRAKRASFLRHAVHLLDLEAEVLQARDDELGERTWNGGVAQAVWPVDEWLRRAIHVVEPGGVIYTLTSEPVEESALLDGMNLEEQRHVIRPSDNAHRYSARIRYQPVP
jgi:16S rRNA (guanine527-N7)-methyltransferase